MKRGRIWVLAVCVVIFVVLRLLPAKTITGEVRVKERPSVPRVSAESFSYLLNHPWVASQPALTEVNCEMVRDLANLETFCAQYEGEGIDSLLINTLSALQMQIPFELPVTLYNVLCISEYPHKCPHPFHVYKRLYLGEMEMGLPFYLDVRVFDVADEMTTKIIAWHQEILDGEPAFHYLSENRVTFTSTGARKRDTAHGFATGPRGLFVDSLRVGEKLFVLYAEAPLNTYQEHASIFKQLIEKTYD